MIVSRKKQLRLIACGITIVLTDFPLASDCYYTDGEVCLAAGTIIWQQAVRCRWGSDNWATLYDQDYLEGNGYRPLARKVNAQHPTGYVDKIPAAILNVVSYGTRRVDPNSCNVTITPNAGYAVFYCYGEAANTNSDQCFYVESGPSLLEVNYCWYTIECDININRM